MNLARHRNFPATMMMHESVEQRLKSTKCKYRPKNLPEDPQIVRDRGEEAAGVPSGTGRS
jgi:hypothetical protein